ncbi:ComF family protein [Patescibacteria group bacterium]
MILHALINSVLDLIFPKYCLKCSQKAEYICNHCLNSFSTKKSLPSQIPSKCIDEFFVCDDYHHNEILKKLIFIYKFKFDKKLAKKLAFLMFRIFLSKSNSFSSKNFFIVPVPSHPKRMKFRGFNPSELLCEYFIHYLMKSPQFDQTYFEILNCLQRSSFNYEQKLLNKQQREEFIRNVFSFNSFYTNTIQNQTVILIDDVAATGSTLNECSRVLKNQGVKKIIALVVAKA